MAALGLAPQAVAGGAVIAHGGRAGQDKGTAAHALIAVLEVALAEDGMTFGALPPAFTVAAFHATEAAIRAINGPGAPLQVKGEVCVLVLTDRACADLAAVFPAATMHGAEGTPAVLADAGGRQPAP